MRDGEANPQGTKPTKARNPENAKTRTRFCFVVSWFRNFRGSCATLLLFVGVALHAQQPVTFDRILRADREPQNWLTYSGGIFSQRYSGLTQITPANVG